MNNNSVNSFIHNTVEELEWDVLFSYQPPTAWISEQEHTYFCEHHALYLFFNLPLRDELSEDQAPVAHYHTISYIESSDFLNDTAKIAVDQELCTAP